MAKQSKEVVAMIKLSSIKHNPDNPRVIRDDKFQKLKQSIQDFPKMMSLRPMVVDDQGIILGGNMRLKALQDLGFKEVPKEWVKQAAELTDEEKQRFIIADNVGFGDWSWDILSSSWDVDQLAEWGLEVPEFDKDIEIEAKEDNYEIPDVIHTDILLGDLLEIGEHRLLCGDSTDSDQVARLMNGEKADMVFTDPPYYSKQNLVREASPKGLIKGSLNGKDSMFAKIYDFDQDKVLAMLNTLYIYSKINTYFCCSQEQVVFYLNYAEDLCLKYNILVWRKPNNVINKDRFSSSIEYIIRIYDTENAGLNRIDKNEYYDKVKEISRYIQKNEKVHHTQKPIELVTQFIELSSLENNLLFEPFLGSGSTMVAAHQLKRRCFGMELEPKYCQVIIDRMVKLDPLLEVKRNGKPYVVNSKTAT